MISAFDCRLPQQVLKKTKKGDSKIMDLTCIKYLIEDTKDIATEYIQDVDHLAELIKAEDAEQAAEYNKVKESGDYSQVYLDRFKAEQAYKRDYRKMLKNSVELVKPRVEHNLESIKACFEEYHNAPLNNDLANKLLAFKQMDVIPTGKDMQVYEKQAKSYTDKMLFDKFAESVGYKHATTPDYSIIDNALNDYASSALRIFDYGGDDAELIQFIDAYSKDENGNEKTITGFDKAMCLSAKAFIKNNATNTFKEFLKDTGIDLSVKPLSDEEMEVVNALIDPDAPYTIERSVKQYAANPIMRDLLMRHDEYRKYLL